jgi:hypothetical protein
MPILYTLSCPGKTVKGELTEMHGGWQSYNKTDKCIRCGQQAEVKPIGTCYVTPFKVASYGED